jgi:hypothetical protein
VSNRAIRITLLGARLYTVSACGAATRRLFVVVIRRARPANLESAGLAAIFGIAAAAAVVALFCGSLDIAAA